MSVHVHPELLGGALDQLGEATSGDQLDLRNMLIVSRAVASSALRRQESRGAHSRPDLTADERGLGLCNITKCCTEGIHITNNAIIPLKEWVVDHRYDPLVKLFRRIARRKRP